MGLSPDDWIMRYADTDSAWELQLTYYERQKERLRQEQRLGVDTERKEEQLKAVDAKIDSLIIQFCLPPEDSCALSEDTVSMYGLEVLGASDTLEAATLITGRYLEVIAEMGVTPDNLRKLIAFGKEVLLRVDVNMAVDVNYRVNRLAEALGELLQDPLMCDILSSDQLVTAKEQGRWQTAYDAAHGRPTDYVLADIRRQEISNWRVDRNSLLLAAATQYARSGDYASAHAMIVESEAFAKAYAFVYFWGEVENSDQMAALNPGEDVAVYESDKALPARYEIAQALVSGDTATMITKALEAVAILQAPLATRDTPMMPSSLQWQQVEQLMDRVGRTGGEAALRKLCRAMLTQLQNEPPSYDVNYLKIYGTLEKSGVRDDYEAVRESILAGPDEDLVKAAQLVESALRAGMILTDE